MDEEIKAGEFKSKCLKIMDTVKKTRRRITITKRNVPIAKLIPIDETPKEIFGKLRGTIRFTSDIIEPIGESWNADS